MQPSSAQQHQWPQSSRGSSSHLQSLTKRTKLEKEASSDEKEEAQQPSLGSDKPVWSRACYFLTSCGGFLGPLLLLPALRLTVPGQCLVREPRPSAPSGPILEAGVSGGATGWPAQPSSDRQGAARGRGPCRVSEAVWPPGRAPTCRGPRPSWRCSEQRWPGENPSTVLRADPQPGPLLPPPTSVSSFQGLSGLCQSPAGYDSPQRPPAACGCHPEVCPKSPVRGAPPSALLVSLRRATRRLQVFFPRLGPTPLPEEAGELGAPGWGKARQL